MKKAFIIGNPRSGTTLIRLMLNAHPKIVSPPECGFLQWWFQKYGDWNLSCNTSVTINEFIKDLKSSKKIETWNLNFEVLQNEIISKKPSDYSSLCELIYEFYGNQKRNQFNVIADKNNYYINCLETLRKIWPDARYILIVRDGRDVACSYKNMELLATTSPYKPKLATDTRAIANEWSQNNQNVIDFFEALDKESSLIAKYEDVLTDTEDELSKMCSFLGESFNEKMLDYYISNAINNDEPDGTIDWKRKTLEKPDITNIGKYKEELAASEIQEFNKLAFDMLNKFNYKL